MKIVGLIGENNNGGNPPGLTELVIGTEKYNLNANGEAVGADGKVIKTKEEIELLKKGTPGAGETDAEKAAREAAEKLAEKTKLIDAKLIENAEIELEDDKGVTTKYKVNKDGALVDAENKVVKTKEELRALMLAQEEENNEVDYVSEIQKTTNITILDEAGKPVAYENTVQGLAQREQDVLKEGRKLGASEYETELFTKFPILKDVVEHLTINGSMDNFTQQVDYSKINIGDDEAQQIDVFTRAKLAQGMSQAEITDMINYYKADKKLKGAAEVGLTYLKSKQTADATARAQQVADMKAADELARTNYWKEVNTILAGKKLVVDSKEFKLPDVIKVKTADGKIVTKTIKDFNDYISKPLTFTVENKPYVMTQHEYDLAVKDIKRTPHNDLFDAYRMFTGYDDSQLIAANVNDGIVKQVIKLKTKVSGGGSGSGASSTGKIVVPVK